MTAVLHMPSFRPVALGVAGLCISLGLFFTVATPVRAAALTETQVQAILSLLESFGASPSVISNTEAALRGKPSTRPTTGTQGITVTTRNGGERWEVSTMNTITWTPYRPNAGVNPSSEVTAYLLKDVVMNTNGTPTYTNVGKIVPSGKASIHWEGYIQASDLSPVVYATPGEYSILVVNNRTGATDISDKPFTLLPRPITIMVNGSADWVVISDVNQSITISWSTVAGVSDCHLGGMKEVDYDTVQPANGSVTGYGDY